MVFFLLLLALITVAAGMFGLGFGVPNRETTFGAAALMAGSVATTGGFILVGLAAAVSELRRVLRQLQPRWEAERRQGTGRRMEPRLGRTASPGADAGDVIPTRFDAREAADTPYIPPGSAGRAAAPNVRGPAGFPPDFQSSPPPPPMPEHPPVEPRRMPAAPPTPAVERAPAERLNAIRPSEYRQPEMEAPEPRAEAAPAIRVPADEMRSPPLSPAEAAASVASREDRTDNGPGHRPASPAESAANRPVRVLKSGTINQVAYTLFSDGSIETQVPDGILRFASIDEFRKHIEKITG
jgi:hypothetical protein